MIDPITQARLLVSVMVGPEATMRYLTDAQFHADVQTIALCLLDGAEVREAVPVLPGGPPRWLDAKGPGRYLVIPLDDEETPNG